MAPTVSLSARVSPEVRARLAAEAQAQGVALATYAAQLLSGPVISAPGPGAGAVQNEVECVFSSLSDEASLEKEVCLALARTVELGGTPGIAAGKELLTEIRWAMRRFALEWDDDEDEDD
jgi:HicB family